jgi:integrase
MPRKRGKENVGLPSRWRKKPSGYYYQVPPGLEHQWEGKKTYKLGTTISEAYRCWATRMENLPDAKTIGHLLDRYVLEVTPTKAPSARSREKSCIANIRGVFGEMSIRDLTPRHVYKYVDMRKTQVVKNGRKMGGPTAARLEIALLSHAYTMAVRWGYIDTHPFKGEILLEGVKPRDRYIEDWEIAEALALSSPPQASGVKVIQAYIRIKLLTALRQGDMLNLKISQFKDDGIHLTVSKTNKPIILEWTPTLRAEIDTALALRPVDISPWLFCTRHGKSYIDEETGLATGWQSMWQRFMARLLSETTVKDRFTEHDLRAKAASDTDSLERAKELLTHSNSNITRRVYRRKPEVIRPTK